jgi:hypothetical protein
MDHMNKSLSFLICGLEHSGTTMVSDLFREHPEIESGFECGVLLCERPRDFLTFKPYCDHMYVGWGIEQEDLKYASNTDSFETFYARLFECSKIVKEKSPSIIFDKTPRYITHLEEVRGKINIPTIAVIKDPRSLALSDFKRSKKSSKEIDSWYESWKTPKKAYMRSAYEGYLHAWENESCLVIRLEEICFSAASTVRSMFEFVNVPFQHEFLDLRNKRFSNTSGSSISVNSCMEFMEKIPKNIQNKILEDFSEFDRWFYPFQ